MTKKLLIIAYKFKLFKMKKMKKLSFVLLAAVAIIFASCSDNASSSKEENHKMKPGSKMPLDNHTNSDKGINAVAVSFTSIDLGVSAYIKSLLQNYLAVKNALIEGNSDKAASTSKSMYNTMKAFDKSLFTAQQKESYDSIEDDLKEQADQIAKSKLEEQGQHFAVMSKDMYAIVKAFGAGMTLYHDHCPMYNNGSMWLSETKDIRNPYYGKSMMSCGNVEEIFQ